MYFRGEMFDHTGRMILDKNYINSLTMVVLMMLVAFVVFMMKCNFY